MPIIKTCNRCKETFKDPSIGFSKNKRAKDGYRSICKECSKAAKRKWYENNKGITTDRAHRWKKNNPDKLSVSARKTGARPEARAKKKIANKRYRKDNPARLRANEALKKLVRRGSTIKPRFCELCGIKQDKKKLCGHHEDYSKPLIVVWLCAKCHTGYHLGIGADAEQIRTDVRKIYTTRIYKGE